MRVLIINSFYYPNMIGGAEHSVKLLSEGLRSKNNEVGVFTVDNLESVGTIKDYVNNILVYRCSGGLFRTSTRIHLNNNYFNKVINKFVELSNYYVCRQLKKVLDEYNPDVVHVNSIYGLSPRIFKTIKEQKKKIVFTVRDYYIMDPSIEKRNRNNLFIKLWQHHFLKYMKYVDYVTAPSKFTLNALIDRKYIEKENAYYVQNAVDLDIYKTKKILNKRRKNNSKKIVYIYIGTLDKRKGVINLLKAFHEIVNENIELVICGQGNLMDMVNYYCNLDNRIKYLGQLSVKDVYKERIKSDVAIVPSIWDEPFGRVVIEANQCGLPVIGSNKAGIEEIIDNIETGKKFQYDDIDSLKETIIYFSDRNNIKKYYNNILNNIGYYSLEKQLDMFMRIYKN